MERVGVGVGSVGDVTAGLLVTDLDGTLMDSTGRIPRRCVEAVRALRSRGVQFTLATGRTARSASVYARMLGIDIPIIVYNGARVEACWPEDAVSSSQVVLAGQLPTACCLPLVKLARDTPDVQAVVHIENQLYAERVDALVAKHLRHDGVACSVVDDLVEPLLPGGCTKVCLFSTPDRLEWFRTAYLRELCSAFDVGPDQVGGLVSVVTSEPYLLEILPPGCNKGSGLRALCRFLQLPPSRVVAVGDGPNDIEMIRVAGVGAAVANAHPALKEASDLMVASNDDCGVAELAERLFLRGA